MKTITGLKIQSRDKNKVNVYLDGTYFCALSLETALKHSLKPNNIIDEKVLEKIQLESEKNIAYEKALKLVSTRYKSQKEVKDYLSQKGYSPATIYYCIKKLGEYDFINDEKYAESFVSHHLKKDGVIKIKQQLFAKGISEEIIDKTLSLVDSQEEQILRYKEKYMKNKEDTKENYIKLYRYLMGKGFKAEEILKVLKGIDEWLGVILLK